MTHPKTPTTGADLTPSFLTGVLQAAGCLAAGRVEHVALEPLERSGFASDLLRLRPRYLGGEGPETLIAKLPPAAESVRQVVAAFGFFAREVRFFRELSARVPVRTPRCYFGQLDEGGALGALLFEDLGALSLGAGEADDESRGLERVRRGIDALACLHVAFWDDESVRQLPWIAADIAQRHAGAATLFHARTESFRQLVGDRAPADFLARLDDVADFIAHQGQRCAAPHSTLLHGDYRLDNLLFPETGAPVMIDWQLTGFGPGSYDLAYFIAQSLSPETRRVRQVALLDRYHAALIAGGVEGYSREALQLDYRRSLLSCSLIVVNLSGTVLENRLRAEGAGPEAAAAAEMLPGLEALFATMTERTLQAIMDEDALGLL
ncbi:MAG: ecdysteroid 22-kinase family protein [Myxococcales bacterium]|nr:ecdysteroid 22-kinase family protein [Myxococcales bacterium]